MQEVAGGGSQLVWVGVKAMLLYLTAVLCFRLAKRRTVAEMSPYDFVAAVAVGAIVGRVPNSSDTSYVAGIITLVTIFLLHALFSWLRYFKKFAPIVDHPPRLLLVDGDVQEKELHKCSLTKGDLFGLLRQHGVTDLQQVAYIIFEQRGQLSIIRRDQSSPDGGLVREVVEQLRSKS